MPVPIQAFQKLRILKEAITEQWQVNVIHYSCDHHQKKEYPRFFYDLEILKKLDDKAKWEAQLQHINDSYIDPDSPHAINIDYQDLMAFSNLMSAKDKFAIKEDILKTFVPMIERLNGMLSGDMDIIKEYSAAKKDNKLVEQANAYVTTWDKQIQDEANARETPTRQPLIEASENRANFVNNRATSSLNLPKSKGQSFGRTISKVFSKKNPNVNLTPTQEEQQTPGGVSESSFDISNSKSKFGTWTKRSKKKLESEAKPAKQTEDTEEQEQISSSAFELGTKYATWSKKQGKVMTENKSTKEHDKKHNKRY